MQIVIYSRASTIFLKCYVIENMESMQFAYLSGDWKEGRFQFWTFAGKTAILKTITIGSRPIFSKKAVTQSP